MAEKYLTHYCLTRNRPTTTRTRHLQAGSKSYSAATTPATPNARPANPPMTPFVFAAPVNCKIDAVVTVALPVAVALATGTPDAATEVTDALVTGGALVETAAAGVVDGAKDESPPDTLKAAAHAVVSRLCSWCG
jgi:hypothetical protein